MVIRHGRPIFIANLKSNTSLLTLGCQEKEEKKVVLIHSFEQKKDTYPIFNEVLERTSLIESI